MKCITSRICGLALIIAATVGVAPQAWAKVRPHHSRGSAQFTSPTEFVGSGHATHLGAYQEAGTLSFTPTGTPGVLHVEGTLVYTAANGAELYATAVGELNGLTGQVTATLTYTGGTGRFADATGTSSLEGTAFPNGTLEVSVNGTIDY